MSDIEQFDLNPNLRRMIHFSFWVFIFAALLSLYLPIAARDGRPHNPIFIAMLAMFGTAFFGILAYYCWRFIKELPYTSVSLDEHGIWKTAQQRSATLVLWANIADLRERPYLQRLDLLDNSGQLLLKIEYQLVNFERVRNLLAERSALTAEKSSCVQTFSKTSFHHVFTLANVICFTILCIYLWPIKPLLSGITFLIVVGAIGWEYFTTAFKIELRANQLVIYKPLQKLSLNRSEIISLDFSDLLKNHARYPQVLIVHKKSEKPLVLRGLNVSAFQLKNALDAWRKNFS
jgi:hypothetical protein